MTEGEYQDYETVAVLISRAVNKAFQTTLSDLSGGKAGTLSALGGGGQPVVTGGEIESFFKALGGANLQLEFLPSVLKGTRCIYESSTVTLGAGGAAPAPADSGRPAAQAGFEVSVGATFRF